MTARNPAMSALMAKNVADALAGVAQELAPDYRHREMLRLEALATIEAAAESILADPQGADTQALIDLLQEMREQARTGLPPSAEHMRPAVLRLRRHERMLRVAARKVAALATPAQCAAAQRDAAQAVPPPEHVMSLVQRLLVGEEGAR